MPQPGSKQRMLRALGRQPADHLPCCFMSFTALRRRVNEDLYELVKAERAMGLDSFLFIPSAPRPRRLDHPDLRGLPVRFHPAVESREWREEIPGSSPILHREYTTPAGQLQTSVRLSEDWPHGDHIPFVDDYQVPRAIKPLVTEARDLEALRFLLTPPTPEDIAEYDREAENARAFAPEQDVLLAGGWGVGADMANWLCGFENLMLLEQDEPAVAAELLGMIHAWNQQRMEVVLRGRVDLYIRRAWYEGCDFLTPRFFRSVLLPQLKSEAALAHERGALFGYICSSGVAPVLDLYLEAGIDVLIGIDPVQGTHTNLELIKRKIGERICLWGGVSGAITVELGSEEEVREAVRRAVETLGPTGFILSPVDNITIDAPQTWKNLDVLIEEWQRRR
ncbi:MAG TPA: uroporphyrinogen decarboxylase family protein [Terriglobia bacterium]|nr:uroporphyrinogen decarboxylase family protein [Terriglobia bacterium]